MLARIFVTLGIPVLLMFCSCERSVYADHQIKGVGHLFNYYVPNSFSLSKVDTTAPDVLLMEHRTYSYNNDTSIVLVVTSGIEWLKSTGGSLQLDTLRDFDHCLQHAINDSAGLSDQHYFIEIVNIGIRFGRAHFCSAKWNNAFDSFFTTPTRTIFRSQFTAVIIPGIRYFSIKFAIVFSTR